MRRLLQICRYVLGGGSAALGGVICLPILIGALQQDVVPGTIVSLGFEPWQAQARAFILFRYERELPEQRVITLGSDFADASGRPIPPPVFAPSAVATIQAHIERLGGSEELACRIFLGGGVPRVYCPVLAGEGGRWSIGLILLALPLILWLSQRLHAAVQREPRRLSGV